MSQRASAATTSGWFLTRIPDPSPWIPDPEYLGFRIPNSQMSFHSNRWILDAIQWIPDSKASHLLDSFPSGDATMTGLLPLCMNFKFNIIFSSSCYWNGKKEARKVRVPSVHLIFIKIENWKLGMTNFDFQFLIFRKTKIMGEFLILLCFGLSHKHD